MPPRATCARIETESCDCDQPLRSAHSASIDSMERIAPLPTCDTDIRCSAWVENLILCRHAPFHLRRCWWCWWGERVQQGELPPSAAVRLRRSRRRQDRGQRGRGGSGAPRNAGPQAPPRSCHTRSPPPGARAGDRQDLVASSKEGGTRRESGRRRIGEASHGNERAKMVQGVGVRGGEVEEMHSKERLALESSEACSKGANHTPPPAQKT